MIIAVAGKGGVGKTTIAALIVKQLVKNNKTPVLAIDADPNSNLGYYLGMDWERTIADIREDEFKKNPAGISKVEWLNIKIQECVIETERGFDMLVMGRPEGPGCYCAVNNLLREFLKKLSSHYKYVVIDNEAGLEHLSRRTSNEVDILFIVAEPTKISIIAAENVNKTAESLPIRIQQKYLVLNKLHNENINKINGLETIGSIRYNNNFVDEFENKEDIFKIDNSEITTDIKKILGSSGIL
ncbi:MAG: AAA family ATPase [Elusimicrobiota bacterium]